MASAPRLDFGQRSLGGICALAAPPRLAGPAALPEAEPVLLAPAPARAPPADDAVAVVLTAPAAREFTGTAVAAGAGLDEKASALLASSMLFGPGRLSPPARRTGGGAAKDGTDDAPPSEPNRSSSSTGLTAVAVGSEKIASGSS